MSNRRSVQEPLAFALAVRGEVLAEMARQGLTSNSLSKLIDRSHAYLNDRLRQSKKELTLNDLDLIARALDLDPWDFVYRAEQYYDEFRFAEMAKERARSDLAAVAERADGATPGG